MPIKPQEVALIDINGTRFYDWESVFVQRRWAEAFHVFRFTAAERDRPASLWEKLQIRPGDECAIYLGDQLAVAGVVLLRQASYDATSHGVMLQGVGLSWYVARASILDEKGNYDDMSFVQVARKVLAPFGFNPVVIGTIDSTPFV